MTDAWTEFPNCQTLSHAAHQAWVHVSGAIVLMFWTGDETWPGDGQWRAEMRYEGRRIQVCAQHPTENASETLQAIAKESGKA
jgi:hypothetical protein